MDKFICFAVGVVAGVLSSALYFKKKYEKKADEEIEAYKAAKEKKDEPINEGRPEAEYTDTVYPEDLRNLYFDPIKKKEEEMVREENYNPYDEPYEIDEIDDFGEMQGYKQATLYYYMDGTLTDDNDDVIENADELVGMANLNHMEEDELDSIYIRNDRTKTDYEVMYCRRRYMEIR